jgi:DNA mismatch repair protein MutS
MIEEYFELNKKYQSEYGEKTILLMQVGSFFEVYGLQSNKKTILEFSQICELNVVEKNKRIGEDNVWMAGFKDVQIDKYIKKIQNAGHTAVVYTQDEAAKNTTRSLAGIFSPGTYFQTEETTVLSNSICCIWIEYIENKLIQKFKGKYVVIGIANVDIYTGYTHLFQYKETYITNNPSIYDELERFISIHKPNEVILISNVQKEQELEFVVRCAGIQCDLIHKIYTEGEGERGEKERGGEGTRTCDEKKRIKIKNCEKQSYQKEVLATFFPKQSPFFYDTLYAQPLANQAFCYLLDFIHQHNPPLVNHLAEPIFENKQNTLLLANHSLKQLNILNDGNVKPGKFSCISHLLNECFTPMGKRQFSYLLMHPSFDVAFLQKEYDIMELFMTSKLDIHCEFLSVHLSTIKDISKWIRQILFKKMPPKTILQLHETICTIVDIYTTLHPKEKEEKELLQYLQPANTSLSDACHSVQQFIEKNIDLTLAQEVDTMQSFETNFILGGIDAELDEKAQQLKDNENKLAAVIDYFNGLIEKREKKSGKSTEYVKLWETEKNNFSILLTQRRCKLLEEALPEREEIVSLMYNKEEGNKREGNKHFDFRIGQKRFTYDKQTASNYSISDPQIFSLCKNISALKITLKTLITKVYHGFLEKFDDYYGPLDVIVKYIIQVDILYTKCSLAKKYKYCKPQLVTSREKSFVNAKGLRHCLLERFSLDELYVTNDIVLGAEETDGILLYGTNAVGKTTIIKALGIAVILAQAGMYVPCTSFVYAPYHSILTRIIGNDNIFKGLSTFAVEMSELRTIFQLCDPHSLILGDELCSGTETQSAISIFVAGIQKIYANQSSFLFATHLHEIVDYEEIQCLERVKLKHMSVVYNKERDELVYQRKIQEGSGDKTYGLEVCKSLGLPRDFMEAAYEIRNKYHTNHSPSVLSFKTSKYNASKIVGICEKCGKKRGTEVHHVEPQKKAGADGYILTPNATFHKNALANLKTLCEACHHKEHTKRI